LAPEGLHYLLNVLRLKSGDPVIIFNGLGGEYQATLEVINKKRVVVHIEAFSEKEVESVLDIHLASGMLRGEKMDLIIQKAVELGVNTITPLYTQFSQGRDSQMRIAKRLQHWQGIVVSSCEQCGRNRLPNLSAPMPFSQWLTTLPAIAHKIISDPDQKTEIDLEIQKSSNIVLAIGPEGGFSTQEITAAKAAGFVAMWLGPRILRAETAAIAAVTVVQTRWGDLGKD
jgi:16S rRNA (uracil1498-N3)-methyltransferase